MAEEKKIIIEILDSGGNKEKTRKEKEQSEEDKLSETLNMLFHPLSNLEKSIIGKNVIVNQAYQQAKQQITRAVEFYGHRYFSLREDYLGEQTYNNAKAAIGKVTGFAGAVATGAIIGAEAGPVGAIVGGVVGAVGYGANEYFNQMSTVQGYNQQLNTLGIETNFARTRAGLVNNNMGTEN